MYESICYMAHIDDLFKFKRFQEKKLLDKVRENLLESLVDFYFEREDSIKNRVEQRMGLDRQQQELLKDVFQTQDEEFKQREDSYLTILMHLGNFFVGYDHYRYVNYLNWNLVMFDWVKWKKQK